MAVYAGFDFRRPYVRQALSGDLTEDLLRTAVPFNQLSGTRGEGRDYGQFKMKPSFAFTQRVEERLEGLAYHEAETCLHFLGDPGQLASHDSASALTFTAQDGASVCPATEVAAPEYERVEDLVYGLENARLHDRGVVMLPVWAVEYTLLGQPFRAFVSALWAGSEPTVAGINHKADARWAADDLNTWRAIGEWRQSESASNQSWKVRRYWLDEVARVLEYREEAYTYRFGSFGTRGEAVEKAALEDYELLGLSRTPPPTERAIGAAFRAKAMAWHPDHHTDLSSEELAACTERFQRIVDAHARLKEAHRVAARA
jgi:hypothetical protein